MIFCWLHKLEIFISYHSILADGPTITAISDETHTEGTDVTIACTVDSVPISTIWWIKPDGSRVDNNPLVLNNINRNEAGDYRCHASNTMTLSDTGSVVRTAQESFNIDVRCKFNFYSITLNYIYLRINNLI